MTEREKWRPMCDDVYCCGDCTDCEYSIFEKDPSCLGCKHYYTSSNKTPCKLCRRDKLDFYQGEEVMKHTCCICGKEFEGYGNDPWPIDLRTNVACCDECNLTFVLSARLAQIRKEEENAK